MTVNEIEGAPHPAEVVALLAQALMRASDETNRAPLDLGRIELCLNITALHARAVSITWPNPSTVDEVEELGLIESLERAEIATRSLPVIEGESATSELIGGLCDAIREARSLV